MPTYLICYDVADDRRRYRVGRLLEGVGLRTQRSVFECEIGEVPLRELTRKLTRLIDPEFDRITIYRLCGKDDSGVQAFGRSPRPETPDYRIA